MKIKILMIDRSKYMISILICCVYTKPFLKMKVGIKNIPVYKFKLYKFLDFYNNNFQIGYRKLSTSRYIISISTS